MTVLDWYQVQNPRTRDVYFLDGEEGTLVPGPNYVILEVGHTEFIPLMVSSAGIAVAACSTLLCKDQQTAVRVCRHHTGHATKTEAVVGRYPVDAELHSTRLDEAITLHALRIDDHAAAIEADFAERSVKLLNEQPFYGDLEDAKAVCESRVLIRRGPRRDPRGIGFHPSSQQ